MSDQDNPYSVVREETTIDYDGQVKVTRKKGFDNKGRIILFATYKDYQDGSQGHCIQVVEADGYWRGGAYDPIIGQSIIFASKKFIED